MAQPTILLETKEAIATITLNRPEKLNAFTESMMEEFFQALDRVEKKKDIRVMVITGAGRGFCSGADIQELFLKNIEATKQGKEIYDLLDWIQKTCLKLRQMPKVTIASINGPAVGLGFTLALACDLRLASEEAIFSMPFVRFGLIPEFGSTYFLPRLVSLTKACELAFTGKTITATQAKEIGLINEVVPASDLETATYDLAKSITNVAPQALELAKKGLYQGLDNDLETQLQYECLALSLCFRTQDHEEGVKAFLDKRQPVFKGK